MGYDANEKVPPLDRGTFSFSSYPLNFALIKSETRFPRRDGNAFKKDFANLKMLIYGDFLDKSSKLIFGDSNFLRNNIKHG